MSLPILNFSCGGGEIRTHGALRHGAFQVRWNKPLSDSSLFSINFFQIMILKMTVWANDFQIV